MVKNVISLCLMLSLCSCSMLWRGTESPGNKDEQTHAEKITETYLPHANGTDKSGEIRKDIIGAMKETEDPKKLKELGKVYDREADVHEEIIDSKRDVVHRAMGTGTKGVVEDIFTVGTNTFLGGEIAKQVMPGVLTLKDIILALLGTTTIGGSIMSYIFGRKAKNMRMERDRERETLDDTMLAIEDYRKINPPSWADFKPILTRHHANSPLNVRERVDNLTRGKKIYSV